MSTLPTQQITAVLLDVEVTTTPIGFVYQTMFPYALSHAGQYLRQHASDPDVRADLQSLRNEHVADVRAGLNPPPFDDELDSAVAYMEWLTTKDRKSTPFKALQGKIWQEGFTGGQLRADVFEDAPRSLARWRRQGRKICIFSSGSVLAQKLLFAHTIAGDLSEHISGYFDTTVGNKTDANSYRKIAVTIQKNCSEILFVSDVTGELDAARAAGMQTLLCVRPGNRPQPPSDHRVIHSFDEVFP